MSSDVAIIGAGLTGLACAQRLQQLGLRVIVIEKSRGLGGRSATRRLPNAHADHGVRCLENQGRLTQSLIQVLGDRGILHSWTDTVYELHALGRLQPSPLIHPRYVADDGITAIAKFLGNGLEIRRNQRVQALTLRSNHTWDLSLQSTSQPTSQSTLQPNVEHQPGVNARAVVVAIPAPQALELLEPLADHGLATEVLAALRSVKFAPCLTAIASYPATRQPDAANLAWQAVLCSEDPDLNWVAIDSTKQHQPQQPVVIIQSTAAFAQAHLENLDLQPVGQQLVQRAAQILQPWLAEPETLQVHRWRYAFVSQPLTVPYLNSLMPLPLICGGDWCGGANLEAALQSGLHCAAQITECLTGSAESEGLETVWQTVLNRISLNL